MPDGTPIQIKSTPGVKRDGTSFDGNYYSDVQWCRFSRGLPRKMQGYRSVTPTMPEVSRGLDVQALNGVQYVHSGGVQFFNQVQMDSAGVFIGQFDRTPAGFVPNIDNLWQIDLMYDSISTTNYIIAHPGQNLSNIDSTVESTIYVGQVDGTGVLTDANSGGLVSPESGGIVVIQPYLVKFGSNGHVAWSVPNQPTDCTGTGSGDAFVSGTKIIRGLPLRGQNASALLWSQDSIIVMTLVGGDTVFNFNTPSGTSTVLSTRGIVEYDSVYFWPGIDRFYVFNGVLQELQNTVNLDWFLDNVNMSARQKCFAVRVPRRGEIWWCFPFGNATECTHAIIYNVREQCWYDTILPTEGRSAGAYSKTYGKPYMVDTTLASAPGYSLWQQEVGFDKIIGTGVFPILSYFETHEYSMLTIDKPVDKSMQVMRIEPDFRQMGDMTVQVNGRSNAKAPEIIGAPFTFQTVPGSPQAQVVNTRALHRLMSFKFSSNTAGGDYFLGVTLGFVEPADGRVIT